ncbi:acetyl-CoA hydrolase/transferase family protein [Pseudomonas sp. zfem002]|uniref:acetyl-CoA hydrolase/transferase family protein n=1 Tax=Pseudomonas sp. zfem002 TaxID=3078197 RepID=UPI00292796F2|nr:acetyl-CoA hydrolase/transferase C-terminal domain-containing protein [Pseudomonas sp. zfem002]MDU9393281.1 acetyl-CoA hydrolase/transferase C-terminal domain-containing protein [Pseudomonas sp. zfem002]
MNTTPLAHRATPTADLARLIRPGDTIMWGQANAEPLTLIQALVEQRHALGRVRVFLGIGQNTLLKAEHADALDFLGYCGSGTNRHLAQAGVLDILPAHYSQFPRLIEQGALRIDVLMLQVPPADALGRYSLGMAREYLVPALKSARVILAEVDPSIPWTYGGPYLQESDFDLLIPSTLRAPAAPPSAPGSVEIAIGRHVASFIEDGATLQTGIGNVPDAVLAQLRDRRELGVHSGAIGDGIAELAQAGVITNSCKSIDVGVSIGGVLIGGDSVRRYAHLNYALELRGTHYTHSTQVLGKLDRFVAINSAIEVDLSGQVNSEMAGGRYVGGVGGILDFLRAAQASRGGVPILALPSTAGNHSRIVASLSGPVTVPRSDGCVIITEHGIADLRGLPLGQRTQRLIAVAAPEHREALERQVHQAKSRG